MKIEVVIHNHITGYFSQPYFEPFASNSTLFTIIPKHSMIEVSPRLHAMCVGGQDTQRYALLKAYLSQASRLVVLFSSL